MDQPRITRPGLKRTHGTARRQTTVYAIEARMIQTIPSGAVILGTSGESTPSAGALAAAKTKMARMALKWSELRRATDDELVRWHDEKAKHTVVGLDYYLDEMTRRAFERAAAESQKLAAAALEEARESRRLANRNMWVAVVAVVVSIGLGVVQLLAG